MKATSIEWTTFSSNPMKYRDGTGRDVWACVKCSSGCANCYAEATAFRYNRGRAFTLPNIQDVTPYVSDDELRKLITARTVDKIDVSGQRCFIGDMTDIFLESNPDSLIDKIIVAIAYRPDLICQLLTKRADRAAGYFTNPRLMERLEDEHSKMFDRLNLDFGKKHLQSIAAEANHPIHKRWPLRNLHFGTSTENQKAAEFRIRHLRKIPAAVRYLSAEPLLGPINFRPWLEIAKVVDTGEYARSGFKPELDWIIVGGESGDKARPMDHAWPRDIRDDCAAAGVPFFLKQMARDEEIPPHLFRREFPNEPKAGAT